MNDRDKERGLTVNKWDRADFDLIDKTVRRLRFFKNFAQNIRLKLYETAKYDLVPPGKIIA